MKNTVLIVAMALVSAGRSAPAFADVATVEDGTSGIKLELPVSGGHLKIDMGKITGGVITINDRNSVSFEPPKDRQAISRAGVDYETPADRTTNIGSDDPIVVIPHETFKAHHELWNDDPAGGVHTGLGMLMWPLPLPWSMPRLSSTRSLEGLSLQFVSVKSPTGSGNADNVVRQMFEQQDVPVVVGWEESPWNKFDKELHTYVSHNRVKHKSSTSQGTTVSFDVTINVDGGSRRQYTIQVVK